MQLSGKKLAKQTRVEIFDQLNQLLADLKKPEEVRQFLNDFLSPVEKIVIAKRLAIMIALEKGQSYGEIKQNLKVSSATIAAVQKNYDSGKKNGFNLAIQRIATDEWADQTAKKIAAWFKNPS